MKKDKVILSEELKAKIEKYRSMGYKIPKESLIKSEREIEMIRKSGLINTGILDHVAANIKEGMTTFEVDELVRKYTEDHGAVCAPKGYEGFPRYSCTSINDEVCHGIPARLRKLKKGDIVNVDVSTILDGYFSDASRMFIIGETSEERRLLVERTKECLDEALKIVKPFADTNEIGKAITKVARKYGYSIVEELGGHGVGLEFHEDPFIYHYDRRKKGFLMLPGMVFTIEPMINGGKKQIVMDNYNGWTIYTKDHSDSAQWEHTILVTEDGYEILTH